MFFHFLAASLTTDYLDMILVVSNSPELRTRCAFNEEMVPGYNCISLHQIVYELLRTEHENLFDIMKPVLRIDEVTEKSYIDEEKVSSFLEDHQEALSDLDPEIIALYFGCFAFLHQHKGRESAILDPLLAKGEPFLRYFGATEITE